MTLRKNQRRYIYGQKSRALFAIYIVFTAVLVIVLNIGLFGNIFLEFFSPALVPGKSSMHPALIFFVLLVWVGYGFLFAYHYAVSQIRGVIYRMGHVFDKIAQGETQKLSFRRGDPFHEVAAGFNKMLKNKVSKSYVIEEINQVIKISDKNTKNALENIIKDIEAK